WDNNNWQNQNIGMKAHELLKTSNNEFMVSGIRAVGIKKLSSNTFAVSDFSTGLSSKPELMQVSKDQQIYLATQYSSILSKLNLHDMTWSTTDLIDTIADARII